MTEADEELRCILDFLDSPKCYQMVDDEYGSTGVATIELLKKALKGKRHRPRKKSSKK